jgi:hypothetical protein
LPGAKRVFASWRHRFRRSNATRQLERAEDEEASDQEPPAEGTNTLVRFVAVSVFDVSQLTPEKRPTGFFTPLEGDADGLYHRLATAASEDGFSVQESPDTGGAEGYSRGNQIVTRAGLPSVNRLLTATHEYAHALLHQNVHALSLRRDLSKQIKECHAEAVSYMVARHFGINNPFSSAYLLQWGNSPETLRHELDAVMSAAHHIITMLEGTSPEPPQR